MRAASKVHCIGAVLGPDRTNNELLPCLTELVGANREADEVLFLLSKSVPQLLDCVGGSYSAICALLELLSVVEETTVRERAVRALQDICGKMTSAQVWQDMFPVMKRLAEAEWFTPRRSACGLLGPIYAQADASHRPELLEMLKTLVADETPMVRRAVASAMAPMALASNGAKVAQDVLLPVWISLTEDPHFSVRVAAVHITASLVQAVGKDVALQTIVPHLQRLSGSRGWRVRNALAGQLGGVAAGLGGSASSSALVNMLVSLARDYEDEVSENAITQMPVVAQAIGKDEGSAGLKVLVDALLPVLQPVEHSFKLRRALAKATLAMAKTSPAALGAKLVPVWEQLFADDKSKDSAEVVRVLTEGLGAILASLTSFTMTDKWGKLVLKLYEQSKSKAVDELNSQIAQQSQNQQQQQQQASNQEGLPGDPVETPKWRIRVNILANLPLLVKTDKQAAVQLWVGALSDETFEVRSYAGQALNTLPVDLVKGELCPILVQFFKKAQQTQTYQHRIAAIKACGLVQSEDVFAGVVQIYQEALRDPVNNVVVSALLAAGKNPVVARALKQEITGLLKSPIPDVGGFAKSALAAAA